MKTYTCDPCPFCDESHSGTDCPYVPIHKSKRGFICGAFDLLHAGHIYTFRECKKYCDFLVVGLQVDPSVQRHEKHKPVETMFERWMRLRGCKFVDQIIPYETDNDLQNILATQNLDIRFLDEAYMQNKEEIIGEEYVSIKYLPRNHSFSSSDLRERMAGK